MSQFIKFAIILVLCTVSLLIFVHIVERSIGRNSRPNDPSSRLISSKEYSYVIANFSSKKLLNLENFEYKIRPSSCKSTFLTWIVTSYAGDPAPRGALRRAYSNEVLRQLGITRVFLLGMLDAASEKKLGVVQGAIRDEAERFRDIVQGNFYEAYRNLTYKHSMGLRWATESCTNGRYIMKQDDDIVINLYEIVENLRALSKNNSKEIFAGYVLRGMKPIREPANKWYVTYEEYDKDTYPDFLSGWLYLVGREIATRLIGQSYASKGYFWIDDVFLTGVLRRELSIDLIDMSTLYTTDYRYLYCCMRGREKKLKCEYAIGPNGGKVELQVDFQNFASFCRNRCLSRGKKFSVAKTCVVEYEKSKASTGTGQIEPIQFL